MPQLLNGLDVVVVAVGLFAVGEALYVASRLRHDKEEIVPVQGSLLMNRDELRRSWKPWLRGTALGFPIGALPAGGAEIPTFLSYGLEKRLNPKAPWGKGAIEGVAGPEAANNAAFSGVLVPLLTLGIPTSATAAILLVAFQIYNLQPGPLLFENSPELVWALIASLYVGNVMLLALNLPLIRALGQDPRHPASAAVRGDPRLRHARRLQPGELAGGRADHVRHRRGRLLHAPIRLPGRADDPGRHPGAAAGAAVPHAPSRSARET